MAFSRFLMESGFSNIDDVPVSVLKKVLLNHAIEGEVTYREISKQVIIQAQRNILMVTVWGEISLVHNGIIENYDSIKKILLKKGYTFSSDTDSEVLVNLIEDIKKTKKVKLGKAVYYALKNTSY